MLDPPIGFVPPDAGFNRQNGADKDNFSSRVKIKHYLD